MFYFIYDAALCSSRVFVAESIETAYDDYRSTEAQSQADYARDVAQAYADYARAAAGVNPDLAGLRHAYDVAVADASLALTKTVTAAGETYAKARITALATYHKARINADLDRDNTLQLRGAAYQMTMTQADANLSKALRNASRQYDKDLKKVADDAAADARSANKAWNQALSGAALRLAQGSITDNANRQTAQATAMGTFLSSIQSAFTSTFGRVGTGAGTGGTGSGDSGTGTTGTGTNPFTAMATMAQAAAGWLSSVLGLAQARDEALAEAAEGKALAEQSALDGLLEGVVDGVLGWVTGSNDARTAYSITAIGLTTARDVAVRTAFAAFDVAAIERGAEAERLAATANKNRIISDVQAYRDEVANSPASNSTPPLDPSIMQPGLLPSEMAQLHAENRARDRSNTLTEWGVTALRTWIATVDTSGVLNTSTTTTTTAASGATGPATTGNRLGGTTNGTGSNSPGDWQQALQQAQAALNAFASNTDPSGSTGANGNAAPGTPPPGNNPNSENPPAGAPPVGGNGTPENPDGGHPPGGPPPGNSDPEPPPPLWRPKVAPPTVEWVENAIRERLRIEESQRRGLDIDQEKYRQILGLPPQDPKPSSGHFIDQKTDEFIANLLVDAIPLIGTAKGVYELCTGRNSAGLGAPMTRGEWWLTLGATAISTIPFGKVAAKATGNLAIGLANRAKSAYDALPALFQKATKSTDDAAKAADEAIDRAIDASNASPDAAAVQTAIEELPNTGKLSAPVIEFRVGRHGDMPTPRGGAESHYGILSRWMKEHYPKYNPNDAPAVLMGIENHNATRRVFNEWRTGLGGKVDWSKVSMTEM